MTQHRALVIEDDSNIALALSKVLQDLRLDVKIAADVDSAEALIAAAEPDAFLLYTLDIILKGDYGLRLLNKHPSILTRDNTIIITSWEDRFRKEVERLGYRCIDKQSLEDKPYATLLDQLLSLPALQRAGVRSPYA